MMEKRGVVLQENTYDSIFNVIESRDSDLLDELHTKFVEFDLSRNRRKFEY